MIPFLLPTCLILCFKKKKILSDLQIVFAQPRTKFVSLTLKPVFLFDLNFGEIMTNQ